MRVRRGYLLAAVFAGLLGLALLAVGVFAPFAEKTYRNTRTGVTFTKGATAQRVEGLLAALFFLGLAVFLARRGVPRMAGGAPGSPAGPGARAGSANSPAVAKGPGQRQCYLCGKELTADEQHAQVCHACRS
jgi:hypothetical protein